MEIQALPRSFSREEIKAAFPAAFAAKSVDLASFTPGAFGLIVVDMIVGFAQEGPLSSPNALAVATPIAQLMKACREQGVPTAFFADSHPADSPEFSAYPSHCLAGSRESQPLEVLEREGGYTLIPKNSTNGFVEPAFRQWLEGHPSLTEFIVVGCCTDICVQQFALSLKTELNRQNRQSRIVVPMALTATYDAPGHPAGLTELASFQNMQTSGIEIVSDIVLSPADESRKPQKGSEVL